MVEAFGILSVGDELLAGDIADGNAPWLIGELGRRGHRVHALATVPDDVAAIAEGVQRARADVSFLLVSGGLGPTKDDLTRDGVAAAFGLELVERAELLEHVQGRNPDLPPLARRQALLPEGAAVLANPLGTAPGFLVSDEGFRVACLPGVPGELRPMARALLELVAPSGPGVPARKLRACGLTESEAGRRLADLMDHDKAGCRVGITASLGVLTVTARGEHAEAVARAAALAKELLGEAVFGEGDVTLAEVVVHRLAGRALTVTTAESCTGGLLAGAITSVPGASAVFREGLVTYANEAKRKRLQVPPHLLERHGAVSEEVAAAMAEGARARAAADFALSITGVAGPEGGTPAKPVGTVCFALADGGETVARTVAWRGDREEIRRRSVNLALELLRRRLVRKQA